MNSGSQEINFLKEVSLSEYTTIGLGGRAKYFLASGNPEDIISSLKYCKENDISVQVFSGGSNIIFSDDGYDGLVMKVDIKGVTFSEEGNYVAAKVNAGENWDEFAALCISRSLTGVECLSGIPGSVGAVPVQNVGAYGQEVKGVIVSLKAINRDTLEVMEFSRDDLDLSYRQSRFKSYDRNKYIITEVTFRFEKNKEPEIRYTELQELIDSKVEYAESKDLRSKLSIIRNSVMELRKRKSMLIDKSDPNSKSCGSFFMNPVLDKTEFMKFKSRLPDRLKDFPVYISGDNFKIPAAWLVEQAGYYKGFRKNGIGISANHSLAIINIKGTTSTLLALAEEIEHSVYNKLGIQLEKEPVIVL